MAAMQASAQQLAQAIVQATAVSHQPGSSQQQRAEAVQFFEQLKHGEIHATVFASAVLTGGEYALEVQVSAYGLLQYLVKQRWKELSEQEQQQVTQLAYQHLQDVGHLGVQAAFVLKSKAAMLLASVIRQQGPAAYEALVPQLIASAEQGPMQAEIACLVLQFVTEDLTQFEEATGSNANDKRAFLAAMVASVPIVLPFLAQMLQRHFQQAVSAAQAGGGEAAARPHAAVVNSALGTLSSFVDWAPLSHLNEGQVVEACAFFLNTSDFRQAAVDVLKQISGRSSGSSKGDAKEVATYARLMDKVGDALMAAAAAAMEPGTAAELDFEGSLEEYGKRLCSAMVSFGEHHFGMLNGLQKQYTFLQHMLSFTRHPYLLLCGLTFQFWSVLLREAERAQANGQQRSATPDGGAPASPAAAAAPPFVVPPECCQMLVEALAGHLQQVAVRQEEGGEVPAYMDSPGEFKELCGTYRGTIKLIVRSAAVLAPQQVLASTSRFLQQALAVCTSPSATPAQKQQHMEAAAQLLEAIVPVLVEGPVAGDASIREGLTALLRQLLVLRLKGPPLLVMLHARAMEAFSRHLSNAPDMVVPLMQATFECMQLIPLEANGQLPPPAHVTPQWKEQSQARTCMAKVLLNVAKLVPLVFISQLQPLVAQVQALWDKGLLRHGERMVLYEGLIAAAGAAAPLQVQTQLLEWVLQPVHAKWSSPEWLAHLASPRAFAAQYMAYEVAANGEVIVGSREQRWTLYHEVTLFERVLRRSPAAPGSGSATPTPPQQQQQQQQEQHPFTPHLEWALAPLAAIITCVHGLRTPAMQSSIAPLEPAFDIDSVERAQRGGEKDASRGTYGDPGTLAGPSLAALQYWMRGVREGAYMVVSFAAQFVPTFWPQQSLAATIPKALVSHVDVLPQHWMRMLLRHGVVPLVGHCPLELRAAWLLPVFRALMPHMQTILNEGWARIALQAQQQQQPGQQATDEVVNESIFRELTREHLALVVKATERSPAPGASAAAAASLASQQGQQKQQGQQESVVETLWTHDVGVVQALVGTAVAALRWPDAPSGQRAAVVCKFVNGLSESSHPELEPLVLRDILWSALLSMVQVSSIAIQPDLLALLRSILVTWLPRSQLAHDTLLQLPSVTPQLLASFQSSLLAVGSEREQRSMIKQLLHHASNEEARAVLNAVSKVPVLTNVSEAKTQQQGTQPGEEIRWDWGDSGIAI